MADENHAYVQLSNEIELPRNSKSEQEPDCIDIPLKKCDLCKINDMRYTCPKCGVRYCGIDCYRGKTHRNCSEIFYRDNVINELKNTKTHDEDKREMIDILKRQYDSLKKNDIGKTGLEAGLNHDADSLARRMEGVDLEKSNFEEIWEKLTDNERKIFNESVSENEIELTELCTPWWQRQDVLQRSNGISNVEKSNTDGDDDGDDEENSIPQLIKDLPSVKELLADKPASPLLLFNISEVILAYAFTYRLYNGEIMDSATEAIDTITSISKVLACNHSYTDIHLCLNAFVQNIKSCASFNGTIDPVDTTLDDFVIIIDSFVNDHISVNSVVLCLSELFNLLSCIIQSIDTMKERTKIDKEKRKKYLQYRRKVYFMAAWCEENQNKFSEIKDHVCKEKKVLMDYWENIQVDKRLIEKQIKKLRDRKQKALIQEL